MNTKTKGADFSVLLLYPDYIAQDYGRETYLAHVSGVSIAEAISSAQNEAAGSQRPKACATDFFPLLAVQGWHVDLAVQP